MYCIVLTTCATVEDSQTIGSALLGERLAACIQMLPIQSQYTWKGQVAKDNEILLLIKTRSELYDRVQACIKANHKYETPEIIKVAIDAALPAYGHWIDEVTK